ncbi:MAG TPA: 50S ribosomal protein L10 [Thermoanaerobaculia bacterium]|jgi:large subunit ribosomal protein L10
MALTRTRKQELIEEYQNGLAAAPHAFLVSFKGITVPQASELRSRVRERGGHYRVVKNTLALIAVDGKGLAHLRDQFQGPTAVAYTNDDAVGLAKALADFKKDVPIVEFKGGVVDGRPIAGADVESLAKLPSRHELIGKIVFLLQSPISRLARGLAAIPRQLVVVLDQIARRDVG